ncbi:hypothetical protein KTD31_03585 [Burkholderia multivorans]|uniref:hypothetical protein n=1 Tax=Burkholderia multivorans TaxID=87883 RepID=UPI001C24D474|nr:hypothetical protein [Burkholderia multivorans]MBU9200436.1 hypothetical protein [Burkholderia multivorans]MDN8078439.1 hypothetical protein [Burkholderia multivorans]
MLSCMETQMGLMVIGPKGQKLRLLSNNPAFRAGRDILRQSMPAEQMWQKLQDLVANPLKALADWCDRFGVRLQCEGDTLLLNDVSLQRTCWEGLLSRMQAVGGSPKTILQFAEALGANAGAVEAGQLSLHLREDLLSGPRPAVLRMVNLPKDARTGDLVNETSSGSVPYLVSYDDYLAEDSGNLILRKGTVLNRVTSEAEAADILLQPAILGFNRTYRCEEGTADGWLEDLSFDSLTAARRNAKDIQNSGAEARIINRITGESVPLL